jgi:hypothetical protein
MGGIGVRADHYRGEAAVWELDRLREPPASGLGGEWDLVDRRMEEISDPALVCATSRRGNEPDHERNFVSGRYGVGVSTTGCHPASRPVSRVHPRGGETILVTECLPVLKSLGIQGAGRAEALARQAPSRRDAPHPER